MKATEAKLLDFLKKSPQFIIPIYQRTYSWTESECRQLWEDILRTGREDAVHAHFVGSIVYIEKGLYQVSSQSPLLVIDGQQRLTTVALILEALARALPEGEEPVDGFSAKKLRNYYLLNPLEDGERGYKLLLTQTDKETLLSLLDQRSYPEPCSLRLRENFEFFCKQVKLLGGDLVQICKGLAKLMVVDIALSRDQDNPQLIFESMNSTGKELSQADLIRNFILMDLEPEHQTRLYEEHWRPMELAFGQEAYREHFDAFMRHYLTVKTDEIPRVREVYEKFKIFARGSGSSEESIDAIVADIHAFAGYYCSMALGAETNPVLREVFSDLRELKANVAYPFLLELYHDWKSGVLTSEELEKSVRYVEAYVFRRAVCAIPTNSMNMTFATFSKSLIKERYLESLQAHFLQLPSYRRFPRDEEFCQDLRHKDLYNFQKGGYLLKRLENHGRKERVPVGEYTIEHIMPQNPDVSPEWRKELGEDWKRIHATWLHTLGNLTLTGYNSEYSDHSFEKKRDMTGGFKESPLRMNEGLGQLECWGEDQIRARAEQLASKASRVWESPSLAADVLANYSPATSKKQAAYTIEDHKHIAEGGACRSLYLALRKEVLALAPGVVSEEARKLYMAFKADTNFCDVVPQAKRLVLTLNLDFHELNDPHGKARDVTGMGRWGNGNVEVGLASLKELPYVMSLVRQALQSQLPSEASDA